MCQYMFSEVGLENQEIGDSRGLIQLHHSLYTSKVDM